MPVFEVVVTLTEYIPTPKNSGVSVSNPVLLKATYRLESEHAYQAEDHARKLFREKYLVEAKATEMPIIKVPAEKEVEKS